MRGHRLATNRAHYQSQAARPPRQLRSSLIVLQDIAFQGIAPLARRRRSPCSRSSVVSPSSMARLGCHKNWQPESRIPVFIGGSHFLGDTSVGSGADLSPTFWKPTGVYTAYRLSARRRRHEPFWPDGAKPDRAHGAQRPVGWGLKSFVQNLSAILFSLSFRRILVHVFARSKSHINNSKHV